MKLTAAVLSAVFAGSYISCVVRNELDTYIAQESENTGDSENETVEHNVTENQVTTVITSATPECTTVPVTTTRIGSTTTSANIRTTTVVSTTTPVTTTTTSSTTSITTTTTTTTSTTTTIATTVTTTALPETEAPQTAAPPVSSGYDYSSPVPESKVYGDDYFDKCVFIGDSHIQGMSGYKIVDDSRVFAKNGLSLSHINENIDVSSVAAVAPEKVYIMMGTNGVMWTNKDSMIDMYEEFLDSLTKSLPSADIYIMGIPPVTAERETRADVASGKYLNSDINTYNDMLLDMASRNNWYYLDVCPGIKDGNGHLASSTDGVHMSKNLYSTFKDYILSHVVE